MKLPDSMSFDGIDGSKDRTDFFLAALNRHGSPKLRFLVTPVRIVCGNTQTAAIGRAQASFGISHTGGARAALEEARRTLKLSWRYVEAFETESAQLYAQAMYLDEMRQFAAQLVDVEGADSATSARNRRDRASAIVKWWTSSPTIAGTRWAAYNAVSEYVDHLDGAFVYEIS